MPKVRHRVNSLTEEREEKAQNNPKLIDLDAFISLLGEKQPEKKALSIAIIGLGNIQQLISVILMQQKALTHNRLYIKVFESDTSVLAGINHALKTEYNCQQSPCTESQPSAHRSVRQTLVEELAATELVTIPGCQRLILNQGHCVLNVIVDDLRASLRNTLAPVDAEHLVDIWLHNAESVSLDEGVIWQMAKMSQPKGLICSDTMSKQQAEIAHMAGFFFTTKTHSSLSEPEYEFDDIPAKERRALRQAQTDAFQYCPQVPAQDGTIAIIGGGIASTHLALSLSERHKSVRIFCKDSGFAQQASGNKQGAIYPLLTPDNGTLSQYFQQGLLFTRRRLSALVSDGFPVANQMCGVLHTGHDERSSARINKIISAQAWPPEIAHHASAQEGSALAGIDIDKEGVFYPLGGWISPPEFTQAAFDKAATAADVTADFDCNITRIAQKEGAWYLYQSALDGQSEGESDEIEHGPFNTLVLANGHGLNQFEQSKQLPATGFRGQVSHIPARNELAKLNTVLCSHGYLTPSNNQLHCTGASYVKAPQHLDYCPNEQLDNLKKVQHSYEGKAWVDDVDITGHSARVGVRMVTRDHAPMIGCAPDIDAILENYQHHQHTKESIKFWKNNPAPIHEGLYILGGLGSRGLTSGPLAAEVLAAQLCKETIPLDMASLALLNPNRMLMRKLIKGKAL